MFKKLMKEIVERVWESSKSTLAGVAVSAGIIAIDQFVLVANSSASPYMKAAAAIALVVGMALKNKSNPSVIVPPAPPSVK